MLGNVPNAELSRRKARSEALCASAPAAALREPSWALPRFIQNAAVLGVSRSLCQRMLLFACRSCGYRWLPSSRKDPNCSAFAASAALELPVASPAPAVTVCVAPALPLAETVTMTADLPMVVAGVAAGGASAPARTRKKKRRRLFSERASSRPHQRLRRRAWPSAGGPETLKCAA